MVPTYRRSLVRLLAASLCLALLAGCGGDDDDDDAATDDTTTTAEGTDADSADTADTDAYCEAELALETAGEPDIDFETMTPEQQAEAVEVFATDTLRPLVDDLAPNVPDELQDHFGALESAVTELETTGDTTAFEAPEVQEAAEAAHAYDLENCGWTSQEVTTTEYAFEGLPDTLDAGVTSFDLANDGVEVHEMVLLRKNEGVTETAEELLALPQAEALQKAELLGVAGPVPTGTPAYLVADLEEGDYIAVCFIPVGTTSMEGAPPADAPPHFVEGMVQEFSVS